MKVLKNKVTFTVYAFTQILIEIRFRGQIYFLMFALGDLNIVCIMNVYAFILVILNMLSV